MAGYSNSKSESTGQISGVSWKRQNTETAITESEERELGRTRRGTIGRRIDYRVKYQNQ